MASSSWSSVTNSPGSTGSSYDVFLSFRGEDTRHNFTDHLYERLMKAGIFTFRDEEDIKRGEGVKPEIEKAIKESRASVVVLSENYATSTWCLDELTLILKLRRESNHLVLPVFYKVEPCDVGKQNKTFAVEVKASSRWTDENVNLWKNALTEVCVISGEVLSSSTPEAECLKKIVHTIYEKLDCKKFHLPNNLSGMAARYKDVSSIINDPNVNFVAICGMGGSGKTTLAKYIYNKNWNSSENMSFLEEVGGRCKGYDDLLQLQEKLLNEILGGKNRKIPSVSQGTCKIEEVLQTKKAFIVLDDIVDQSQLVTLLGSGVINAQIKIIVTTRVLFTEELFRCSPWRCQKYEMRLLNDDESLELLYHHALGSKLPTLPATGFKDLAVEAVHYCEGNPLALEVLGSSLSLDNSIQFWESTLSSLRKDSHDKIQHVLIGSYNSLRLQVNRELFLHIACFFVGKDKDYVEKILEPDFSAISGIQILCSRCLLSVSSDNKLMMHRLLQEMGKHIVRSEEKIPGKRTRVWLSSDSYNILSNKKGSETVEGLALDMIMLRDENFPVRSWNLTTDAFQKMDELKLLNLNSVYLEGSYENVSGNLRWLCWLRCHLRTIPINLSMEKLVAIDLSYSNLEVFDPPMVLQSLKILNLKDSHKLSEIRNLSRIPRLETLVLWNCHELVHVGETIGGLKSLSLVNMTGCESLWREHTNTVVGQEASTSGGGVEKGPTFSFPRSLHRLFLKDCNLECTESFPLSFSAEKSLQYLNLGNSLFEFLPCYDHLKNLRVLDLSFCARLKCLLCLPSTLAELYVYYCNSLEKITFQSQRFTLQEFGYEGCISLSEIEGFIKLVPLGKLEENDLGHLKWVKEYQNHEVCLVGDDELTIGRSSCVQMLYEFGIMSTSLPDIKGLNLKHDYLSEFASCSFDVPLDPKNRRLKGLDVTLKYTMSSDDDWVWFCKISTTNGVDLIYNPKVFGKPDSGKIGIWSSYWPIGNALHTGDTIYVSVAVISGLRVHECGVSLVYVDDKGVEETLANNMIGGDLTGFQLSTGAYYLCRRDFLQLMEFGRLIPDWFRILFGNTINVIEVRGWRKTGQPKQMNPSFTELKTIRCIIHGPELEDIYRIPAMSKASSVDKPLEATSSMLVETMKYDTSSKLKDVTLEEENLITAANLMLMAVNSNKKITNKTRKILVDLNTSLTSMAKINVPEDEHMEEDKDLSDIKEWIYSTQEKIMIRERDESMIWDSYPAVAKEYLKTVNEARIISESLESLNWTEDDNALLSKVNAILETSMGRLQEEFRHILLRNRQDIEPGHLSYRSSEDDSLDDISSLSFGDDSIDDSIQQDSISRGAEFSIMDMVNPMVITDLKEIATCMFDSNYGEACCQVFISVQKDALDEYLFFLEIEKVSIEDFIRLEWVSLNSKIKKWTKAIKIFVRVYLASEKLLCEQIFEQGESVSSICFTESSKASMLHLLNFAKAVVIGPHQPEILLRILEMYEVISDLMPDIENLYSDENGFYIRSECHDVLTRVGDCVMAMYIKFEKKVGAHSSNTAFPGGGIHPLTRYVMNYTITLTNYSDSLNLVLKEYRAGDNQTSSSSPHTSPGHENDSVSESSSSSPMALHFRSFMSILERNLEEKSKLYKDEALGHLFMMNNINYMAEKVKTSDLRNVIGDDWFRKQNSNVRRYVMGYERATWSPVLYLFQEDSLPIPLYGSSNSTLRSVLRERLQAFYSAFEDIYKNQTGWSIPNSQLREELGNSISIKVSQAYRTFVGRFASTFGEKYNEYTSDDLENWILDLFGGTPKSLQSFHKKLHKSFDNSKDVRCRQREKWVQRMSGFVGFQFWREAERSLKVRRVHDPARSRTQGISWSWRVQGAAGEVGRRHRIWRVKKDVHDSGLWVMDTAHPKLQYL
ncbi:hypothetical protein LXL04_028141 [Taraxacum kok-saghyz]